MIDDPYDAGKRVVNSVTEYRLDMALANAGLAPENSTIILGPGVIETQGFRPGSGIGFAVKKGWRIVGGGWGGTTGPTILKATGLAGGAANVVFGCGTGAGQEADGFEVSSLEIDCGMVEGLANFTTAAAIDVNGSHIRVHDIRMKNFGARTGGICDVMTIARPAPNQSSVFDCVAYNCVIESPSAHSNGTVRCVVMKGDTGFTNEYHQACVFRDSHIDCGDATKDFIGVWASGGRGTIIECNRIWRTKHGFYAAPDHATLDVIFRDNYLYDVLKGFEFFLDDTLPRTAGRVVLLDNFIDLTSQSGTSPVGIKLWNQASANPYYFGQAIIRKNQIRHTDGGSGPTATVGIDLDSVKAGIVEENLISIGDVANPIVSNGIKRTTSANVKTFNNQTATGVFLPSTYGTPTRQDPDLVMEAQDWMIGA